MYKKVEDTNIGIGYINDEYLLAMPAEFDYGNNHLVKIMSVKTYYDDMTGLTLYGYKDLLLTFKELRREYLVDYYNANENS